MNTAHPLARITLAAVVSILLFIGTIPGFAQGTIAQLRAKVNHIVVIYQENWSFDSLYGRFPGANGISNASPESLLQLARDGTPLSAAPAPLNGKDADPHFSSLSLADALKPYDLGAYLAPDMRTGDIIHRFYTQQLQIDGGKMDKFVAWSDNGGLVMSSIDATNLPEGRLAQQYTLCDNFFHAAFGGSFLNHIFLVAAAPPVFPNAPAGMVATPPDSAGRGLADKVVTPDGYAVNTAFTVNQPHPAGADPATLVPNQTLPTIGDRLSEKHLAWAWYSGGWNDARAGHADPLFQYHHQAFAFFKNFADGTEAKRIHLRDEKDFLSAVDAGTLPAVSFVKPLGPDNEHPGYAALLQRAGTCRRPGEPHPFERCVEGHRDHHHLRREWRALGPRCPARGRSMGTGRPRADDRHLSVCAQGIRRPHAVRHDIDPEADRGAVGSCGPELARCGSRRPGERAGVLGAPPYGRRFWLWTSFHRKQVTRWSFTTPTACRWE